MVETWILLQILNGVKTGNGLKNVLKLDMALIQRSCDRLVKKKWIARSVDPHDRRAKILILSKEGKSLVKRLIRYSKETNIRALSHLSEEQQNVLRHLLINILRGPFCDGAEIK